MLVVAGAGTGKTTVLARRIAHLIESEAARPKEILAVTYTRNAAAQLITKVGEILYPHLDQQSAATQADGERTAAPHLSFLLLRIVARRQHSICASR